MIFVIGLQLIVLHQIHKLKEVYVMTTAELLAALDEANTFTAEIASDIDRLIEIANNPGVPTEVADAVNALKGRLADAAGKYTASG